MCGCLCSASAICENFQQEAGILWGDSQEITPCSHIILSSLSLLSCPLPLHSPPDTVTPPLCCRNVTPAQFFEKPFHFSLLSETCSNGLLSLHMVSSVIHIWCNICWPFLTSDSGCNYDRPNAPLNCTARLLLAALHFICPAGLTLSSFLRFNLKLTLLDVS